MAASLPEQGRLPASRAVMAVSQSIAAVMSSAVAAWVRMNCLVKSSLRSQARWLMSGDGCFPVDRRGDVVGCRGVGEDELPGEVVSAQPGPVVDDQFGGGFAAVDARAAGA